MGLKPTTIMKHLKFLGTIFISIYGFLWLLLETSDFFGTVSLKNAGWKAHLITAGLILIVSIIATYVYFSLIQSDEEKETPEKYPGLKDFKETFRDISWKELIEGSSKTIDIVVYYFDSWVNYNNQALTNFLLKPNTKIRVFVANPDDPFLIENVRRLFNEYNAETVKEKVSHTYERFLDIYAQIGADKKRFEFYYYPYFLNYSLQVFDSKKAVFSVFEMYRKQKIDSPALVVDLKKSTHLGNYVKKELDGILSESKRII